MVVCWLGVIGDCMCMLFIIAAFSTYAVSGVSWVNVVLTLFLSKVVLVPCCVLESASVGFLAPFGFSFCSLFQEFIVPLWPLVFVLVMAVTLIILVSSEFFTMFAYGYC